MLIRLGTRCAHIPLSGLAPCVLLGVLLAACVPVPLPTARPATLAATVAAVEPTATSGAPADRCVLPTVVPPTPPAEIPGYTQLDPATGLHMTGTPHKLDLLTYRLKVTGKVARPLELSYDDLRCLRKVERELTLVCPGFFTDKATWAGVPLADVLALAEVQADAVAIRLTGADGYSSTAVLPEALSDENFLAYEWNGEPLPYLHGFPLRAVFPSSAGSAWVKWLVEIRVE